MFKHTFKHLQAVARCVLELIPLLQLYSNNGAAAGKMINDVLNPFSQVKKHAWPQILQLSKLFNFFDKLWRVSNDYFQTLLIDTSLTLDS